MTGPVIRWRQSTESGRTHITPLQFGARVKRCGLTPCSACVSSPDFATMQESSDDNYIVIESLNLE